MNGLRELSTPFPDRRPFRWRWLSLSLVLIGALAAVYLVSWEFSMGSIGYFSPDTLETHSQRKILIPGSKVPIYRSFPELHRYALVSYLIEHGYWTPRPPTKPLMPLYRWNQQWKDGHSDIVRQFDWKADDWIEWTQQNEATADVLWPTVLELLRSDEDDREDRVAELMQYAWFSSNLEEFEEHIRIRPLVAPTKEPLIRDTDLIRANLETID